MKTFIPKGYKKEQITIRLDSELLETVDMISQKNGLSRSEFINQCTEFALENMVKEKKNG